MARVRSAEHRDLDVIEQIENDADQLLIDRLKPESWLPAPTGLARLSEPSFLLVVELDDGRVAGFVHVLEVDGVCHMEQLSVALEHTRQGLGRTLLVAAMQHARERGYSQISLRTYADVPWNAPLYATAGFVIGEPATTFHRSLIDVEAQDGLDRYGRRVHMVAHLGEPPRP